MIRIWRAMTGLIALAVVLPSDASAQLIPSEKASVSQTIDGTTITVNYSRPRSRGRDSLIYGTMEPWGRAWTPGADDATTIEFNRAVHILGNAIPAGRYSVWMVLRERTPWTIVLEPRANLFHTQHPDSNARQFRAPITPQDMAHTEVLTWSFPEVGITGVTLEMRWGLRGVSIPVGIVPTFPLSISAADAAPYVGEYELDGQRFNVEMRGNAMIARAHHPDGEKPTEYQLLPLGNDRFVQGMMLRGEVARTSANTYVQFTRTEGRVTGLETWADKRKTGTAQRRP